MSRYTVTAQRTAKWWVLQCLEAPGAISQVARLDQADQIKEAIAFVTGEPAEAIEIEIVVGGASEAALQRLYETRARLEVVQAELRREQRNAARELVQSGLSYRDVGAVMHLSHQRVGQLVTARDADD